MFIYSTGEKKPTLSKRLTIKHKEKIDDEEFIRKKKGCGPGRVLNQFSSKRQRYLVPEVIRKKRDGHR